MRNHPIFGRGFNHTLWWRAIISMLASQRERLYEQRFMGTLTKREIVLNISNETGMVQHQVFDVVQKTLDQIVEALARGENIELRNFGVFEVKLTKPRVGRNPNQPGSSFVIPARATVKFKSGKIMKQRVGQLTAQLKASAEAKPGE
jgi:nucleoid DNA-binding protein